jgi:hypothetical protein
MDKIIKQALEATLEFLPREFKRMPLERWSEAVFRYYFCRFLSRTHKEVRQDFECSRIDLVLRCPPETAFVEFKFYRGHPSKFELYTGERSPGFKGGPGAKNLSEFQDCVNKLAKDLHSDPGFSKYLILFYVDPQHVPPRQHTYSMYYDDFKHPDRRIRLDVIHEKSLQMKEHKITCKLFKISVTSRAKAQASAR